MHRVRRLQIKVGVFDTMRDEMDEVGSDTQDTLELSGSKTAQVDSCNGRARVPSFRPWNTSYQHFLISTQIAIALSASKAEFYGFVGSFRIVLLNCICR